MPAIELLIGFHIFILAMLALDLGVFQRQAHKVSMREAGVWSVVWITLAMTFAAGIWQFWDHIFPDKPGLGPAKGIEFVTGYLVEISLSVDNLFVFLVIFTYFGVPEHLRHRVLFWGIVGAVIMRATFILVGSALLALWHPVIYFFGAFLVYTGLKLLRAGDEEVDLEKNFILRIARKWLPVVNEYDSPTFWVYREVEVPIDENGAKAGDTEPAASMTPSDGDEANALPPPPPPAEEVPKPAGPTRRVGKWFATPLPLVLLVVESTDVVFAVDSIPAIFGITTDIFIVYTSNIFAVLGLRAMYFLLANILGMFRFLKVGLAFVLMFVGVKMLTESWLKQPLENIGIGQMEKIVISLGTIVVILGTSIAASLLFPEKVEEKPAEEAAEAEPRPAEDSV